MGNGKLAYGIELTKEEFFDLLKTQSIWDKFYLNFYADIVEDSYEEETWDLYYSKCIEYLKKLINGMN